MVGGSYRGTIRAVLLSVLRAACAVPACCACRCQSAAASGVAHANRPFTLLPSLGEVFYSILRAKPEIAEAALADLRAVRERVRRRGERRAACRLLQS